LIGRPDTTYILVVDDEPDVLNLVEMQLERAGFEVLTAESGLEALRVLRESGPPTIAVIDVAMPELSGLDLVRVLRGRSDTAELPVVFLSARVLPSDVAAGEALGASYVTKPFTRSSLLHAIDAELGGTTTPIAAEG
jgi:DNA-binding response OmpR family regulator